MRAYIWVPPARVPTCMRRTEKMEEASGLRRRFLSEWIGGIIPRRRLRAASVLSICHPVPWQVGAT